MKKYFIALAFAINLLVLPIAIHASDSVPPPCPQAKSVDPLIAAQFGVKFCSVNQVLVWAVQFLLGIIAMVAVLFIVYGGFLYVTSGGNGEQAEKGRAALTNAIIGLVIAVLAYAIVSVVNNSINSNSVNPGGASLGTGDGSGSGSGSGSGTGNFTFDKSTASITQDENLTVNINKSATNGYNVTSSNTNVVSASMSGDTTFVVTGIGPGTATVKVCPTGSTACRSLSVTVRGPTTAGNDACTDPSGKVYTSMQDIYLTPDGDKVLDNESYTQKLSIFNHTNVAIKNIKITWDLRNGDRGAIIYVPGSLRAVNADPVSGSGTTSTDSDAIYQQLSSPQGLVVGEIAPCGSAIIQFDLVTRIISTITTEAHISGPTIKTIGDASTIIIQDPNEP